MNKNFYTPENIEAFLENRLSPSEKAFFESEIAKDPLLQNEVNLQNDIINSLKIHRRAELKNRLNKIEVSAAPSYTGAKIAASLLLGGLVTFGLYSYFNNPEETVPASNNPQAITQRTEQPAEAIAPALNNEEKATIFNEKATSSKEKSAIANAAKSEKSKAPLKSTENSGETIVKEPTVAIAAPQGMEDFTNDQFRKDENMTIPLGNVAQTTETKSGIDIKIDNSTADKFHYKYYNNKLFLYGSFDSQTYEILELNSYNGKQVYLLFENNYYQLKSNQLEVSPLEKITDKKLTEELNKFNK